MNGQHHQCNTQQAIVPHPFRLRGFLLPNQEVQSTSGSYPPRPLCFQTNQDLVWPSHGSTSDHSARYMPPRVWQKQMNCATKGTRLRQWQLLLWHDLRNQFPFQKRHQTWLYWGGMLWYDSTLPMRPWKGLTSKDFDHMEDSYFIQHEDEFLGQDWLQLYAT